MQVFPSLLLPPLRYTGLDLGRQDQVMAHLVEEGILDGESIEKIESTHKDNAATALLIEDLLEEETLLQSLAVVFDTPPAGYTNGLFIERELLASIDSEIIREYEILPVRLHRDQRVDILVVEPVNEIAHEILENHFQMPIRQYIWPRIRFLQACHFFLGDSLPEFSRTYLREHPVTLGFATPSDAINVHQALRSSESLLVSQWRREDVRSFLKDCFDRDTLLKVLLGYSGHWLTNRLIVVVGRSGLQPYFMEEWPELAGRFDDVTALRDVRVDPSAIEVLRDAETWQSGSPEELSLSTLFEALEVETPPLLVGLPLRIGGRTAMALLGVPTDTDAGIRLDEISETFDVDLLQEAVGWVGDQLEEMIRRAKADTLPPPAERIPPLPTTTIQVGLGFEDSLVEERIARRGDKNERHRWEIVDISHVIEESSAAEEVEKSEPQDNDLPESDDGVIDAVASALSSGLADSSSHDSAASSVPEVSEPEEESEVSQPNPGATSFGMPALQEESSKGFFEDSSPPQSEGGLAELLDQESQGSTREVNAEVDDGWSGILSDVSRTDIKPLKDEGDDLSSRGSDAMISDVDSESEEDNENISATMTPLPSRSQKSGPSSADLISQQEFNGGNDEESAPEDEEKVELEDDEVELEDEKVELEVEDEKVELEVEDEKVELEVEDEVRPSGPITGVTSLGGFSVADIAKETPRATQPKSLNIPTNASGVPMAQIFRRPGQKKKGGKKNGLEKASSPQEDTSESDDFDRKESITGRTMLGLGEMPNFNDIPQGKQEKSDASLDRADASSWLDDLESGAQPSDPEARPGGTVKMDAGTARTQTFNELLVDMDSENLPNPNTIPVEVLEEVPQSGPIALEIEESLGLLDSRDKEVAFAAAEHLAISGPAAVKYLKPLFPGRIFVDRYQYTIATMPPVNEHGPILEALVRIGQPSLAVVQEFIDDASLECRFYATYLLTELPAHGLITQLFDRLFDRDQQTRSLAQDIVFAHRSLKVFATAVVGPLREVLEKNEEEFRVEIAVENLRRIKDLASVPLLIDALHEQPKRIRKSVHRALREITFQSFAAAPTDWRRWWSDAEDQPRWRWLVEAMNSKDDEIRMLAFDEIEQLPGLEFNYHPDQPAKLRIRAQKSLTEFFEEQSKN